jgi:hypothetical protein
MWQRQLGVASFLVTAYPGFSQNGRHRGRNKNLRLTSGIDTEGDAADASSQ